jgi:hypothetical protein
VTVPLDGTNEFENNSFLSRFSPPYSCLGNYIFQTKTALSFYGEEVWQSVLVHLRESTGQASRKERFERFLMLFVL